MKNKLLAYLVLLLGAAQLLLVLASWLLTAAMPETFLRSLTSSEGIRWFFGHFVDHLASPLLVWLVLISITVGAVRHSKVLHYDHKQYRQRTAMRLVLFELVLSIAVIMALTLVPHAILLNVVGGLFPSSFSHCLVPYVCFSVLAMSISFGLMSESVKGVVGVYESLCVGIRLLAPCFIFYVLLMQLYTSLVYLFA